MGKDAPLDSSAASPGRIMPASKGREAPNGGQQCYEHRCAAAVRQRDLVQLGDRGRRGRRGFLTDDMGVPPLHFDLGAVEATGARRIVETVIPTPLTGDSGAPRR